MFVIASSGIVRRGMPFDVPARVIRHEEVAADHFLLTLDAPAIARSARPGQFVMLRVRGGTDPLLRRPMSLFRVQAAPGRIQILYKVVGLGTRYLAERRPGSRLETLGPLGNGFRAPGGERTPILVAGGIGIAIFPFLLESLRRHGRRPTLLFGARRRRDLVAIELFRARRVPVRVATEDGSAGAKGFVTALLEPLLERRESTAGMELFVCGPTPMLRAVGAMAARAGVPCQLALESTMPCGIGVCLGCVVPCAGEGGERVFRRVCTEGPIFDAGAVQW